MSIYRVEFLETIGDDTFTSHVLIDSPSEEAAENQAKINQRTLARRNRKGPIDITILSTSMVQSSRDRILDILWDVYPDTYMDLWEPEISSIRMIKDLAKKYPKIYKALKNPK